MRWCATMRANRVSHFLAVLLALGAPAVCAAAPIEQEVASRVERLRRIDPRADAKAIERYNREMDEAWRFYEANDVDAVPVLRKALENELTKSSPHDLVLLDVGHFLYRTGTASDRDLGKRALFAMNARSTIARPHAEEIFKFAHRVVAERDPRALAFVDRAFLEANTVIVIPQHAMTLEDTLIGVFLYGVYGEGAEAHLRAKLADPGLRNRVLEILIWIGSTESVPEVSRILAVNSGYETFIRAATFMMQAGGPEGRAAMVALDTRSLDDRSRVYYDRVSEAIKGQSYGGLHRALSRFPGDAKLDDKEVLRRLAAMAENYGKDDKTSPSAILDSGLPKDVLIRQLMRVRARTLHRLSNEALTDLKVTNNLINALRYRPGS